MPNRLIKKFEALFESEQHHHEFEILKNENFQTEENNKLLENIKFESSILQWPLFFSRLSPFFEVGFYIENNQIKSMFYFGETVTKKFMPLQIKWPKAQLFNVLKTQAAPLLKKMGIQLPQKNNNFTALFIRVENDKSIILLTSLAEPWLKLRCESLKKVLLEHDYYID